MKLGGSRGTQVQSVLTTRRQVLLGLAGGAFALPSLSYHVTTAQAQSDQPQRQGGPGTSADSPEEKLLAWVREVLVEELRPPQDRTFQFTIDRNDQRTRHFSTYTASSGKEVHINHTLKPDGGSYNVTVMIREAGINNARNYIKQETIDDTIAKYFVPLPEVTQEIPWREFRQKDNAPTIEKAWKSGADSIQTRGAALWGQNPAEGPGNYLVMAAQLWPGSLQYRGASIFAEP